VSKSIESKIDREKEREAAFPAIVFSDATGEMRALSLSLTLDAFDVEEFLLLLLNDKTRAKVFCPPSLSVGRGGGA